MSGPFEFSAEENDALTAMQQETPQPEPEETEEGTEGVDPDAEAEPEGEVDATQPEKPKRTSMVPQQALHQERERRKAIEAENQRFREERAALNERLAMIREMNQPKADEPAAMPDIDQDPFGAIRWLQARVEHQEQERQQFDQERQQQTQQATQWQQFANAYNSQAKEYAAENPDFDEAYAFLQENRWKELKLAGFTDQQAAEIKRKDEADIAWQAMQRGENPAKVMHQLAKHRGWQPKQAPTAEVDKIKTAARGVQTNRSLSAAGGSSGSVEMTAESLAKMSREDFAAWSTKNPKKLKALMGG